MTSEDNDDGAYKVRRHANGTRFSATCPVCMYEFIDRRRADVVNAVKAHEAECSDDDAEWTRYTGDDEPEPVVAATT